MNMNFGQALEALKQGEAVQRTGWNGKGIKIFLNKGAFSYEHSELPPDVKGIEEVIANQELYIDGISVDLFEAWEGGVATRLPNISLVTATGSRVEGYVANQSDMLAEDWQIVE